MDDTQVWNDLERFAAAMKRGATVVMNDGSVYGKAKYNGAGTDVVVIKARGGIREIIEPPQKKVRPLNAEEWGEVVGCITEGASVRHELVLNRTESRAVDYAARKATCHPPGNSKDVRKLWVEE